MSKMMSASIEPENDPGYDKVKNKQEASGKAKNMLRGAGYARGGGVGLAKREKHSDEAEDKKLIKAELGKARIKAKKHGGKVDGRKPHGRADKFARGGSVPRGHTKININMSNPAEKQKALHAGVQLGAALAAKKMAGGMRPGAGAPPMARGPMPPPGAMPPSGAPPGGGGGVPPTMGMAARGGRQYKRGGAVGPKKVPGVTNISEGGGGGAKGRLEKIKKYGTKGR